MPVTSGPEAMIDLTGNPMGVITLLLFAAAYLAVMAEEFTRLRKSKCYSHALHAAV